MARALVESERLAVPLVFLEGDPAYYGSRGFRRADQLGFRALLSIVLPPVAVVAGALHMVHGTEQMEIGGDRTNATGLHGLMPT